MIPDTQSAQISQKQDWRNMYVIMKTMCPPGYHHSHCGAIVVITGRAHCFHDYIYLSTAVFP